MENCLFCRIAGREIPAKIVAETANLVAFRDISPQAPVHILIISKKHIPTLNDISQKDAGIISEAHILAAELAKKEGVSEDGYRLVMNVNAGAGQSVFHIHWHLLGGRVFKWPPG
jgi:histidine triad (HIT) family protein